MFYHQLCMFSMQSPGLVIEIHASSDRVQKFQRRPLDVLWKQSDPSQTPSTLKKIIFLRCFGFIFILSIPLQRAVHNTQ